MALAILGTVLIFGLSFFVRRRQLERERLDREGALRLLESEWVYLRTSSLSEAGPREKGAFLGSPDFLALANRRTPALSIRTTPYPGLYFVRLDAGYGIKNPRRLAEEGYVFSP